MLSKSRKRFLLPSDALSLSVPAPALKKRSTAVPLLELIPAECGRLVTCDRKGRRVLVIELSKTFNIGRAASSHYCIPKPDVSAIHCKLFTLTADSGEVFVCLEDVSTNGTMWNDRRIARETVVLTDGDEVEVGGQTFVFRDSVLRNGIGIGASEATLKITKETVGEKYLVLNRALGTGSFGVVSLAFNNRTLKQVACKTIRRRALDEGDAAAINREVAILKQLHHPNINAVEDVVHDDNHVHIFLELISGGDLFAYLEKQGGTLDAPEAKFIFYQILCALDYLHGIKNISHRDLKLENIIVSGPGPFPKVLLADFGAARVANSACSTITGTLVYLSPEAILAWTRQGGYDGKKLDMWSSGIILAYVLSGYHPFNWMNYDNYEPITASQCGESFLVALGGGGGGEDQQGEVGASEDGLTCSNILHEYPKLSSRPFGSDDKEARILICHLLTHDPEKRCTAAEGLQTPWILKSQRELERLWGKVVGPA